MSKDRDYIRLINTARWRKLRTQVLSNHPLCVRCEAEELVAAATEVHHITPVESGRTFADKERLAYDPANLIPLCHLCHLRAHMELGRRGKDATDSRVESDINIFLSRCK